MKGWMMKKFEQILEDLLELVDVSWDDFNDIDLDQNGIDSMPLIIRIQSI